MSKEKKHLLGKFIGLIVAVIIILALAVVARYWTAFNGFLDKITQRRPELKEYSVLVTESSEYHEIKDLKDKTIGFLKTDELVGKAEQHLQEVVKFEPELYEDIDLLVDVLKNNLSDAIVLETDRIDVMKEETEDSLKDTREIYNFTVEIEGQTVTPTDKEINIEPTIVYISGSDSRTGVKATARSDVNILAVINPKNSKILLVSIPRDTYVQLHGTTGIKDKLTHAGVYGINMSKTTIEDFLNIKIDYTIKVSFDTVVKVVDEIDGIEIDSDQAMTLKTKNKTCNFTEGKQQVDGDCALRFSRERKSYSTGDRHRGENQQQVIAAIISKLTSSDGYLLKIPTILDIAADSFETDISREDISTFVKNQLANHPKWQVESISVDGVGSYQGTYSMGVNRPLYVMIPNNDSVLRATKKINQYLEDNNE